MYGGEEGLSQAILSGSQDEKPEIGYGGGDFVQKLLASAQCRDEATVLQSPTPVKPASRVGLRRNRRTSKERELALLALRMPPQTSNNTTQRQQLNAPSPGPVTRSRSSQPSSCIASSPSNGLAAGRSLASPGSSLDDSTETLFGAIPPTPTLLDNGRKIKPSKVGAKLSTTIQKKQENVPSALVTSDESGKQPRTPQNRRVLSFSNRISTPKSSTPLSTPTLGGRTSLRGHVLLSHGSPVSSQPATASPAKAGSRSRGGHRSRELEPCLESDCSTGDEASSSAGATSGRPERRRSASLPLRTKASPSDDRECEKKPLAVDNDQEIDDSVDDSWDEDFLSQVASQVENKFMRQVQPTASSGRHVTSYTFSRSPRIGSGGGVSAATRSSSHISTLSRSNRIRTPRKKRSKEREPSAAEPLKKQIAQGCPNSVSVEKSFDGEPANVKKATSTRAHWRDSQSSTSSGDLKRTYTEEEILRKRQAAVQKRQQKRSGK